MKLAAFSLGAVFAVAIAAPALAHHSFAMFDADHHREGHGRRARGIAIPRPGASTAGCRAGHAQPLIACIAAGKLSGL